MIGKERDRAFRYAVLASLALHAAALVVFPDLRPAMTHAVESVPIVARLLDLQPVPAPPPQPAPEVAKSEEPRLAKPKPRPQPQARLPAIESAPLPPSPPVASPEPPPPSPPSASASAAPSAAISETAPSEVPSAPPRVEVPEALSRDQYRLSLIDEARRHKRYPPLARENNWQGAVGVGVAIARNGRASVTLRSSSGHDVLDRQALEMFTQAARSVAVPPALRGKEFVLEVRAVYGLED